MLSVNSCLTSTSIQDIIKSTADPIVDAANYPGMVGAGRINAYQAVLAAQGMYSSTIDLFMKDITHDFGVEPDPNNSPMWISDDIWVRKQNDGFVNQTHQNPEYWINPNTDNYIYVRVRNKSCTDFISTPSDLLHLHWAKAASALSWPSYWDGTAPPCAPGAPMGDEVPSSPQQIPNIPAGGEIILEFPWHVPNPALYSACNPEPWHFCLLSRIDSPQDPMTFTEAASVYDNAKNNNNIAWKNLTVVDSFPGIVSNGDCFSDRVVGGTIAIGNPFDDIVDNYKLEFMLDDNNRGIPIFEQAEIKLTLDDLSWEKWIQGGQQAENIEIRREDCHQLIITGNPAYLNNLAYNPNERSTMHVSFNFLTDKVDETPQFDYHVIQRRSGDEKIIGGELYRILKPLRYLFGADGGSDDAISEGSSTTLNAATIGESAYYNWYDEEGNLIYSGNSLTVTPEITTKYKLEVIAMSDGFASYDTVTVKIKDCEIQSITPNPATTQITVQYKAENISSGYLVITHPSGTPNDNFILNLNQNTKVINTSNYAAGNYNLILICDGQVRDTKVLNIQ
jgi:serine protease